MLYYDTFFTYLHPSGKQTQEKVQKLQNDHYHCTKKKINDEQCKRLNRGNIHCKLKRKEAYIQRNSVGIILYGDVFILSIILDICLRTLLRV